ncbi:hypothetical protein ABBQ32_010177 [Trebouxia sp. C0010 RCD-2024]
MGRFQALRHIQRCTRQLAAGDPCSLVPARLLSNSQASTSAADGSEPSRQSARGRDPQKAPQARDQSQRSRDIGARAASDQPNSADPTPSRADNASLRRGTGLSAASDEPEPGFVEDGAYTCAASEVDVTHLGGSTETAWEFLGSVDEQCITWFGMDFTRGTLPEVERNALLSNEAKEMIYQMHKHDEKRYTVPSLATLFKIRQQRVMAILALKGMEHGELPVYPGKQKLAKQATSTAAPATPAETEASDPAQDSVPESEEQLDVRGQAVKAAMEEAATEVPRYLDSITKESESWQVQSVIGTPEQQAADSNILTAWIKSMVKDPFWVRPSKDEEDEPLPDFAHLEETQDDETMSKADEELEQQFLQDHHQEQQRDRTPADAPQDANTPQDEGYERYMLSDPDNLHHIMAHDVWDCHEAQGTGERHVKFIPRYPRFEFFKDESPEVLAEEEQAAAAGHAGIDRPVISFWENANRIQADKEEAHLVREFKERLRYNLQQVGHAALAVLANAVKCLTANGTCCA